MSIKDNYFFAKELAELHKISKQTLIFYDKKNILKPAFIDNNGYRMYSLKQYFILDIILDLKKMGFHLKDIITFLDNRDTNNILELLHKQLNTLTKQKAIINKLCDAIQSKINLIETYNSRKLNEITLSYQEKEYFLVSDQITLSKSQKERFLIAAELLSSATDNNGIKEYDLTGFIFTLPCLDKKPDFYQVFCKTNENNYNYTKNYDLYLQIFVNHNFHDALNYAQPQITDFCAALDLNLSNTIFIKTFKNYWTSDSHSNFISKIEIPIIKKN